MEELPENITDAPEITPPSAAETAPKRKKVIGRPITKENAKQYQLSAARAKAMRKEARAKMLSALAESMDLGKELLKAMKGKDEKYLGMIEKATRLVGLQHDQSEDAIAQKISLNAKTDANVNAKVELPNINITFEDAKPEER